MITILYFGWAREAVGISSETMEIEGDIPMDDLWDRLVERRPGLAPLRTTSRIAMNMAYLGDGAVVTDGSEIAIIPPVAGG